VFKTFYIKRHGEDECEKDYEPEMIAHSSLYQYAVLYKKRQKNKPDQERPEPYQFEVELFAAECGRDKYNSAEKNHEQIANSDGESGNLQIEEYIK
jgi:hypothetical protein